MNENLSGSRGQQPYARYERLRQSAVSRQNGSPPRSEAKTLCHDEDDGTETSPTSPKRQAAEQGRSSVNPLMVHIIEDEDSIRRALSFMLKRAGFGVTAWASGKAFLDQLRRVREGCILLDIRMPDMDGLEVQQALKDAGCALPVIILSGHGDISMAVQVMKAGAIDFLEKSFERGALLSAIDLAFGRIEQADQVDAQMADASLKIASLTTREQEILDGLALGLPNKTIAYDLGISARTVEVHRHNLMMKLQVKSFPEALRIAFAAGMGN